MKSRKLCSREIPFELIQMDLEKPYFQLGHTHVEFSIIGMFNLNNTTIFDGFIEFILQLC